MLTVFFPVLLLLYDFPRRLQFSDVEGLVLLPRLLLLLLLFTFENTLTLSTLEFVFLEELREGFLEGMAGIGDSSPRNSIPLGMRGTRRGEFSSGSQVERRSVGGVVIIPLDLCSSFAVDKISEERESSRSSLLLDVLDLFDSPDLLTPLILL